VFSYAVMSIRCLLVVVLAASAIGKVWHRPGLEEFGRTLQVGLRLPRARLVAGAWVAGEGFTAILLALPLTVGYAAVLAVGEFGCLTAGAALLVSQHRGYRCHCFGTGQSELSWWTVLRNGALTMAALLLAAGLRSPASAGSAPVLLAAALTVLVGGLLVWQARPLRALLEPPAAARRVARGSALSGGDR
jgi:Methylamine utilisation protein MauE